MGCWNETCALSHLPILEDDAVKLFIVTKNAYQDRCSIYAVDYTFNCLPISGKYNDYGTIDEIVKDWNTEAILKFANEQFNKGRWIISERGVEMQKYTDDCLGKVYTDIKMLIEHIERTYLEDKATHSLINFVMVHDAVYENIMKYELSEQEQERIKDYVTYLALPLLDGYDLTPHMTEEAIIAVVRKESELRAELQQGHYFVNDILGSNYGANNPYGAELFETSADEVITLFADKLTEIIKLIFFMRDCRIPLTIQPCAGSQACNFEILADYYKFLSQLSEKKDKDLKQEWNK